MTEPSIPARPRPPAAMIQVEEFAYVDMRVEPAPDVWKWIEKHILEESGAIHNPDHSHLLVADIEVMWGSTSFAKKGRTVIGQAEEVALRAGGWQKARMEQQMTDWFGRTPKYLITLAADFCDQCSDADFCALVEHELYHIAQKLDPGGVPKFNEDGMPMLEMRAHDVEEFVGVVRRYGPNAQVQEMIEAAKLPPEVSALCVSKACGTCLGR